MGSVSAKTLCFALKKTNRVHAHTCPHLEPAPVKFYSPQLTVQRLNHSCKAATGLVQVQVAGPQTLSHGLLTGETEKSCLSVEACRSEGAGGSGGLLQAPLPEPPPVQERAWSGAAATRSHRERALEHGQRQRTLAASSGHTKNRQRERLCSYETTLSMLTPRLLRKRETWSPCRGQERWTTLCGRRCVELNKRPADL